MTNEQIIADIAASIYGEEAVEAMLANGEDIPLHTVKGWNERGSYHVKKGEHGIQTKLWKKRKRKKSMGVKQHENISDNDFFLAKAFLFRADQMEQI